ncbi:hypothetical protein ACHAQH_006229 [Verticillium albo-atrum]
MSSHPDQGVLASSEAKESNSPTLTTEEAPSSSRKSGDDAAVPTPVASSDEKDATTTEGPHRSATQTTLIMIALCLAVFLAALDSVIITTALPTMSRDLGASDTEFAWIGSSYLLANAASSPFWGKVSDIFGRKSILIIANIIFLAGSLVCALAYDLPMLLAGRTVQGIGGGGLITLVEIAVGDMFSQRERGLYFGIVGAVWAIASAIGPVLGGVFAERLTWRWCFWINLPFDGLSLIITILYLNVHNPRTPLMKGLAAIDWLGSALIVGATLMFLFGLESGGVSNPWDSPLVICLIVFGLLTFVLFGIWERYARYPLIPRQMFANMSTVACFAVVFLHGLGFIALAFFLPLYFQAVLGASPEESGVWLLALALSLVVFSLATGIFIQKTGKYLEVIRYSMVVLTLALGLFIDFGPERSWPRIIIFQMLVAAGVGANMQTLIICIQALVPQEEVAVATATLAFIRQLALAVSVVIGSVIFQGVMAQHSGYMLDAGIPRNIVEQFANGGSVAASEFIGGLSQVQQDAYKWAATDALSKIWIFYCAASGAGLILTFGIRKKELLTTHEETVTGLDVEEAKRQKNLAAKAPAEETAINGEKAQSA